MRHLAFQQVADADTTSRICRPRCDVVAERGDGPGRFVLDDGPFAYYERTVALGEPGPDGHRAVSQEITYELPPGTWRPLLNRALGRALREPRPGGATPWWFPSQRPDARSATVLGLLAMLSLVVGYHGTLLSQTMTFAADEFGASRADQGLALGAARLGGVLAIVLGAMADRRGRRRVLLASLALCVASTALGAVAPNLATLATTQAVNRGAWAAATILLAVMAAEEMPKGSRAYGLGLLSMSTALGAGLALALLPLADLGDRAWRLMYLFPLVFVPVLVRLGRLVPESRRYERPHGNVSLAGHHGRLLLLAAAAFLLNVFVAPQTQFRNEFLRDERGMSATAIALFILVTSVPGSIGITMGGRLADTHGRRVVCAVACVAGTVMAAASFGASGPSMWLTATLGTMFMAALDPIVRVYGPELFPTSLRGKATGILSMTAMAGSVVGLGATGALADALGSFVRAFAVVAMAPMLVTGLVLWRFPETARRELEDLNPEDRPPEARRRLDGRVASEEPSPAPAGRVVPAAEGGTPAPAG